MPTINQLSSITTLTSSDQLVVYQTSSGDARKASLATFLSWFEGAFASPEFAAQYASPTVSGFVFNVASSTNSIWVILQPANLMAAGTLVLPALASLFDGQEVLVVSTAEISALTVNGNGVQVIGAPTYLPANGSFMLRFNALNAAWYCVQPATIAGPTYAAQSWTPHYNGGGVSGSVTFTGRLTTNGRQVTNEVLIEVGANPMTDAFKWTYATDSITHAGLVVPLAPWGAPVVVPALPLVNTTAMAIVASSVGAAVWAIVDPTGGADFTLTAGQKLHLTATYTI